MSIHEKLQSMRCELQSKNLKKSGKNEYAGYSYFELSDFLPTINELLLANKMSSMITFDKDTAKLAFYDWENNQSVEFSCPMSEASLKGCHAVQNLGATMTYIRRYLYINALEIVENDLLDASHNPGNGAERGKPAQGGVKMSTQKQQGFIHSLAKELGKDDDWLYGVLRKHFDKESTKELTAEEASKTIEGLQKLMGKKIGEGL